MTLILSNDDVETLLTMRECIAVMEEAYAELAEGRGVSRTRSDCFTPTTRGDALYSLKSMDGVAPSLGVGAVRINSDIITWPKRGNAMRRDWCCCSRWKTVSRWQSCPTASCSACAWAPPTASRSSISPARMQTASGFSAPAGRPARKSWRPAPCAKLRAFAASAPIQKAAQPSAMP